MKEIATDPTTPEHLMQMLDARMAMQRARSSQSGRHRTMFLVGGVLFILLGAGVALMVLAQMLAELPHGDHRPAGPAAHGNF